MKYIGQRTKSAIPKNAVDTKYLTIFGNGQIAITHNVLRLGGRFNAAKPLL